MWQTWILIDVRVQRQGRSKGFQWHHLRPRLQYPVCSWSRSWWRGPSSFETKKSLGQIRVEWTLERLITNLDPCSKTATWHAVHHRRWYVHHASLRLSLELQQHYVLYGVQNSWACWLKPSPFWGVWLQQSWNSRVPDSNWPSYRLQSWSVCNLCKPAGKAVK